MLGRTIGSRTIGDVSRDAPASGGAVTDTDVLHKPVNCVLAGQQVIHDRYREHEIRPANRLERTVVHRSPVMALED